MNYHSEGIIMRRILTFIMITGFICVCSSNLLEATEARYRRLPVKQYVDKMKAGWIGQMAGVGLAKSTEFRFMGELIPEDRVPTWTPEMVNQFDQDDLYVEMTFVRTLEQYGMDVSSRQAGIDFANTTYLVRRSGAVSRANLRNGIAPPDSGHPKFNGHADDIDYQNQGDYAGLISPGLPNSVVRFSETFGRLMHYDGGVYGGRFVGGMYAEAFFETDPEKIVRAGLRCVPEGSVFGRCISDVLAWYKQNPQDWEKTWKHVENKYHKHQNNPDYRPFSKTKDRIVAKVNGAYIAMGLLYGKGDLDKTMAIATRCGCGLDADYSPSNAVGVLFTTIGLSKLPDRFTSALNEQTNFSDSPYNFQGLVTVCEKLARQAVIKSGGRIKTDEFGREVFLIPAQEAKPGKPENCWQPGPVAESRFTEGERKRINPPADKSKLTDLSDAIAKFAPGWSVSNCADDMVTGLYGKQHGKENVLLTHPLDRNTACVLSKRVKIPEQKKTTLRLVVGHHEQMLPVQADWTLVVKANGKELLNTPVNPETTVDTWRKVAVDFSDYAGQEVNLELFNQPSEWAWEGAYWAQIRLESK